MNREMSKIERGMAIGLCFALFMLFVRRIIGLLHFSYTADIYNDWDISEFMINYQGGFVRRGLLGEIFYQLFILHPYPFPLVILWFEILSFVVFFCVTCYILYKKHWIPILPLAILWGIWGYRRDFLMMFFAFVIYYLIFQYIQKRKFVYMVFVLLLSSISVLIYEPSFFFIIPISMFLYWNSLENKRKIGGILSVLKVFIVPLLCMFVVCMANGNNDIANAIWDSWQPLFDYQGITSNTPGISVAFLGKPTKDVIMMHLGANFGIGTHEKYGFNPLKVSGALLMFIGMYFLTFKTPSLKYQTKANRILLSDMYIFQFICLLPMFTILSIDLGRTINYVIYTSYYLVYFMEKYQIDYNLSVIHRLSNNVYACCNNTIMSSLWFYIIILLITPYFICGGVSITHPLGREYMLMFLPKIQSVLAIIGL